MAAASLSWDDGSGRVVVNKALLDELLQLSPAERIELAQDLWDSIPSRSGALPPLTPEQEQEIERRLAEHERNPDRALPWEEVRARLWARHK
jgi:putative addiction module component (TIGR02574 family)